jgi:hypothetical protein
LRTITGALEAACEDEVRAPLGERAIVLHPDGIGLAAEREAELLRARQASRERSLLRRGNSGGSFLADVRVASSAQSILASPSTVFAAPSAICFAVPVAVIPQRIRTYRPARRGRIPRLHLE